MKKIRVLIVDDSALIRQVFSEVLSQESDIEVVGTAVDPYDAREKIKQLHPDVVTLDIEMPKMDGLSFLEKIMTLRPMPVIMASSLTQKGADETIRALEIGAFDYISKPVSHQNHDSIKALKEALISKVRAAACANVSQRIMAKSKPDSDLIVNYHLHVSKRNFIVAIGSSTGGVEALREIFIRLPKNSPPIIVTQHMPENFTRSFAARLDSICQVNIQEATNHARLKQGHVYIAPGGSQHLKIVKIGADYVCKLEEGPTVSGHRPSVDVLFNAVAEVAGPFSVGVILTGMGKDGAAGLKAMRDNGAYTIGQDKQTCVVYGMPQVAFKMGAVKEELPLVDIAKTILQFFERPA